MVRWACKFCEFPNSCENLKGSGENGNETLALKVFMLENEFIL
jgi:hypothetical protein